MHEKPCCGLVCSCDGEDTWNDPSECVLADDTCSTCNEQDGDER